MMANNYEYSKIMLHHALERRIPFIYASYGFGDIPDPPRQIGAIGELPALLGL